MKQNRYKIGVSIFISLIILAMGGCTSFLNKTPDSKRSNDQPVIDLTYCDVNVPSKLCVASFGTENENKTLVNFITVDPSFPDFKLIIQRNGNPSAYECQRVKDFPTSIYCVGERISLGETIELEVFSKTEDYLIAKGNLSISFLAVSTSITISTVNANSTPSTLQATPSQTPIPQVTPSVTGTVQVAPSATGTSVDSYPNSSYP